MTSSKSIFELVEEIRELAEQAHLDDARSAMIYCVKQLRISAASRRQSDDEE